MSTLIVDRKLSESDAETFKRSIILSRTRLENLSSFYPGFSTWFDCKVLPGLYSGERALLLKYVGGSLAGIAVIKQNSFEKKLCCLRVMPGFDGSGVGVRLFETSFDLLGSNRPLLSVCEEQLPRFRKIFQYFGFDHVQRYEDFYRYGSAEHSYNGTLTSPLAQRDLLLERVCNS